MAHITHSKPHWMHRPSERGSSLVSVIVGLGIMGIVMTIVSQTTSNNMKALTIVEKRGDLEDLRRYVRLMDCPKTFPAGVACIGGPVAIRSSKGTRPLVATGNGTVLGHYTLRATCRLDPGSGARRLSVNFTSEDRNGSLFDAVPLVCPAP